MLIKIPFYIQIDNSDMSYDEVMRYLQDALIVDVGIIKIRSCHYYAGVVTKKGLEWVPRDPKPGNFFSTKRMAEKRITVIKVCSWV